MNQPARIDALDGITPTFHKHDCPTCGTVHELLVAPPPHAHCWRCVKGASSGQSIHDRLRTLEQSIPAQYIWARFDDKLLTKRVGDPGIVARAQQAAEHPRVVLYGKAGTGKTSLGVAMLREAFLKTKQAGLFVTASALASARIKHSLGDGEPELVERCFRAKWLLIDDLGTELAANTSRGEIADVLSTRYNDGKPVWLTTWLEPDALESRYGEGVARRILEGAKLLALGGAR